MSFKTDGSSHKNGIKNERQLLKLMEDKQFVNNVIPNLVGEHKVLHIGGTTNKEDLIVKDADKEIHISAKYKTNINKGSYDWVNSSSAIGEEAIFKDILSVTEEIRASKPAKSVARARFNKCSSETLDRIDSVILSNLLQKHVLNKNIHMRMMLTDGSTNTVYSYNFSDDPLCSAIANMTPKLKNIRAVTSRKIIFTDSEGKDHDYGLRIRLVTNNGISKLCGAKPGSSNTVIKIQQDKTSSIIKRIPDTKLVTAKL